MILSTLILRPKSTVGRCVGHLPCWNLAFYHQIDEFSGEELLPSEWYTAAYAKILRLTHVLKDIRKSDGRLFSINGNTAISDDYFISHMQTFESLAKIFIRPTLLQRYQKKTNKPAAPFRSSAVFSKPSERNSMMLNSLTEVCDFLNVSAQKRKHVRLAICPQVTQHHIWRGALEEVLRDVKNEMDLSCHSTAFQMGEQILSCCIKFLTDINNPSCSASPSWMRPAPLNKVQKSQPSRKWEEVLQMIDDLSKVLEKEQKLAYHLSKLDIMKEGLHQIKDIFVERDMSHKEVQLQDCLIQKKLSKNLGHSSKCLFILLLYYLHGTVREIEVEVCGGLYSCGGKTYLCIGKILTSSDEASIRSGIMQLNRAFSVFQFVWQTAEMDGILELQGHVWCPEADERSLTYKGNMYFVHGLMSSDILAS
ncbi:hypothetical protein Cni_G12767 [Canna indica]|uniref:Uncharacterized protein n=1 Tax=Canna indica TaxID=4628 RepID=A0AAQ3KE28_9LILI|nr:hypothetical protein Cni_G12767 [Canna indica]